ncbi:MAG: beta-glucosidase [Bacteroidales bacterium]|nr:beta-glucosidase [Bacteroidales bacterium]
MSASGYPAHVHLKWNDNVGGTYELYRADETGRFDMIAESSSNEYMDFSIGKAETPRDYTYRICPKGFPVDSAAKFEVTTSVPAATDSALLDMVQEYTLRYFTDFAHPHTGLARERSNDRNGDIVTTGGTGFGLMSLIVGAERGFIPKERSVKIIEKTVTFLENCEKFHGAWAHWYDGDTGKTFSFSKYDDGGDIVETAFLVEGLLAVRQWLADSADAKEKDLSHRCDKLWKGVEWDWYTRGTDSLYWHWSKNHGWKMNHRIKGFDETFIAYVLGVSSPTHPFSPDVYYACYPKSTYYYNGKEYYGIKLDLGMELGGPLFFTHYSYLGLDPKAVEVHGSNLFDRNRAHTLIHYNYAIDNPKGHNEFGADLWGFTSSDDPLVGYTSHHPGTEAENGTVSPTAAISSIVYTPEESLGMIRHLYYDLGEKVFGKYGFYDSYNPSMVEGQQVVKSYLAIDQGPQVVMIENYRSGMIWDIFMTCPEIQAGLRKLGFTE